MTCSPSLRKPVQLSCNGYSTPPPVSLVVTRAIVTTHQNTEYNRGLSAHFVQQTSSVQRSAASEVQARHHDAPLPSIFITPLPTLRVPYLPDFCMPVANVADRSQLYGPPAPCLLCSWSGDLELYEIHRRPLTVSAARSKCFSIQRPAHYRFFVDALYVLRILTTYLHETCL